MRIVLFWMVVAGLVGARVVFYDQISGEGGARSARDTTSYAAMPLMPRP